MRLLWAIPLGALLLLSAASDGAAAAPRWCLVLPDSAVVNDGTVLLRDVATGSVPAAAAELVLHAGGKPNTTVWLTRQGILRRLVSAGLAGGVSLRGAERCQVQFTGRELSTSTVTEEVRRLVQPLVPPMVPGAPVSWFEIKVPDVRLTARGEWRIELERHAQLIPGRNLLRVVVLDGPAREALPVTVELHSFDEIATVRLAVGRDAPLDQDGFVWTWADLATIDSGLVVGRRSVEGASATRSLATGDPLRMADLKETPLILAGDPVELRVARGTVAVSVRAFARQAGCLGQTIPVRNELTGRLVNARVAGPGLVEWRR